jgi:nucleoredoxin
MRAAPLFLALLLVAMGIYAYNLPAKLPAATGQIAPSQITSVSDRGSSLIPAMVSGHLVSADGTAFEFPASEPLLSVQYLAIYYSAQWCPPCHAFTPVLVDWYRKFKPSHPTFELVFVSNDRSKDEMVSYMNEMGMPWPAFAFDELRHEGSGIEKYAGRGIPDLVLINAGGETLSDSFSWTGAYLGPQHVIEDIERLVPAASLSRN